MGKKINFLAEISGGGLIYGKYPRSLEIYIPQAVAEKHGLERGMRVKVVIEIC